jgi:cobyrinic acid a,c-diamide synthase
MAGRRLVIAGTHSGVGKTTVALALMAALRRRGLTVQPFKVGPDFIDPGHHTTICGRISRNLDTWMLSEETVCRTFHRASAGADISIVEGVMGLFDGRSVNDPRGSTAHLAKLLDAPVLLVIDAGGAAASAAAIVKGFASFDPGLRLAGVLCNRVAGPGHYAVLEAAIRKYTAVPPAGWLPRCGDWHIPARHLGLMTAEEWNGGAAGLDQEQSAAAFEATVDVELLLQQSHVADNDEEPLPPLLTDAVAGAKVRLAVARDAAFCFYYQDNLDLLRAAGAEIIPFSPLDDPQLPPGVAVVYLGGGYPEMHAKRLAANATMRRSLRDFHCQGGRIYAECGGLMYCCRELIDVEGRSFPMLDLLAARTVMQKRRAALGYVSWRATRRTLLGPVGTVVRGHVYHYSRLEPFERLPALAELQREGEEGQADGFGGTDLLAGYAHLHFASQPEVANWLVAGKSVATASAGG